VNKNGRKPYRTVSLRSSESVQRVDCFRFFYEMTYLCSLIIFIYKCIYNSVNSVREFHECCVQTVLTISHVRVYIYIYDSVRNVTKLCLFRVFASSFTSNNTLIRISLRAWLVLPFLCILISLNFIQFSDVIFSFTAI